MVRVSCLAGAHRSLHAVLETACFGTPIVSPECLLGLCLEKTRDDMPQREVLVRFGGVLVFFCFGKVLSVGALDQLVEHD